MQVTVTPAPRSSLTVRVELPSDRLDAAIAEAVRHLSQRTRIAGFRPGKAPRAVVERVVGTETVLDEAMDHLTQRAYRDARILGIGGGATEVLNDLTARLLGYTP